MASPESYPAAEVRLYGAEQAPALAERIWPVYRDVFGDVEDIATWRGDMFDRHADRDGYRLAVATDGDAVAGFSWGYVGERGQYWPDLVGQALPASVTAEWVGGHFEFVELAVSPPCRRRGIGGRLHDSLLAGVSRRCLLSTSDDQEDPAVQLYLSRGWRKLGVLRPGVQVMGRSAP